MSDNKEHHKCYFSKDGSFDGCKAMRILLENDKNLEVPSVLNFKTGSERNAYVCMKPNKRKGVKGLAFNLCPFCGEDIMNEKGDLNTDKIPYYEKPEESR